MTATTTDSMIGKRLDKYEVLSKLGAGGMGAVYEGKHVATGRRVAIKVILGDIVPDEALIARFQREARAAGTIESRHIAQVLDAGKDDETGAPWLVMELLQGEDVDALVKRDAPLPPALALRIVAQALAGLERAHAANVVHRDIKPANLYLAKTDGGQRVVKLVDFGIAKVRDDLASSREHALTQTSALLGSPLFMSPEQARASKSVDGRADIWSIGTVLYQMLAGRAPHADADTLTELLLAICTTDVPPIQDRAPWIAPEIAVIVHRALAIDVRDRYASATEMREAIAAIVPDWQTIDDAMLVPLAEAERAIVAARAAIGTATGPNEPRPSLASSASIKIASSPGAHAVSAHDATVSEGLSATQGAPPKRSRSLVWPITVAAGAAALAIAVFFGMKHGTEPVPAAVVASPGTLAPPASAMPLPSAKPEPEPEPVAVAVPASSAAASAHPKPVRPKPGAPVPPAVSVPLPPKPKPTASSAIDRDFN